MAFNEKVLARAKEREIKEGISYPLVSGKLYKTFKWIYLLAVIFNSVVTSFYVAGFILLYAEGILGNVSKTKNYGISFALMILLMIAMLILSKFNTKPIIAAIFGSVNLFSSVFLIITFSNYYHEWLVTLNSKFYLLHLLPNVIIAICSLVMTYIAISSYFKMRKSYNRVLEIIFTEYNKVPFESTPDWDRFVENFKF
ncbi:MAG: hypothetical protein IKT38_00210 [Clostridia bacterium]|nr:hypothetical protein [Clostridia bacterium]